MRIRLTCLAVLIPSVFGAVGLSRSAQACGTGTVLFADTFDKPDPGWIHSAATKIGGGVVAVQPIKDGSTAVMNNTYIFPDADVCAQIKVTDFSKADLVEGALAFWLVDFNTYYTFAIRPAGTWSVVRKVSTRWITISSGRSDAIKRNPGDQNELEVRLSGNTGSAYVNGTKIIDFNGQSPAGGGFFGFYFESETDRANIWEVRGFKILQP